MIIDQGLCAHGLVEHDGHIDQWLKKLDEIGSAGNTIAMLLPFVKGVDHEL